MQSIYSVFLLFFFLAVNSIQDSTRVLKSETGADSVLADTMQQREPVSKPKIIVPLKVSNIPFKTGEKLTFKLRYGFIRAGTATMTVKGERLIRGHPVYHIQTTAESAAGFRLDL